jgi:hypothetical protein
MGRCQDDFMAGKQRVYAEGRAGDRLCEGEKLVITAACGRPIADLS